MSLKVVLSHRTSYDYASYVSLSPHVIRLRPAPHSRTPIEAYSLKIEPQEHFINWQQDPFGNYIARIVFPKKTKKLSIDVEIVADMITINPFDFFVDEYAKSYPFSYAHSLEKELFPYLETDKDMPLLQALIESLDKKTNHIIDFLVYLNTTLNQLISYTIRLETGMQTPEETLRLKKGSCRDFAWLFVHLLRHLGLASRFVSGYLVQLKADVASLDGPSGPQEDFTDLHAWTEVYIPGAGWIGLDATSGLFAGEGHIPLACTPSYESAHAIEGMSEACETTFSYANTVTRLFESPRVTKPYREDQWRAIDRLGGEVDEELIRHDVRLSMGGEPTFVSIDDMEAPEWNIDADGAHKRERAEVLSRALLHSFGKGGMLHHAQGKWYPGEPLPRWQTSVIWRCDGKAIWKDPTLLADLHVKDAYTNEDAHRFLAELALTLGVSEHTLLEAYEDPLYYIIKESALPIDVDPMAHNLDDPLERQSIAQVLTRGLKTPVGYVLPLNFTQKRWVTSGWKFRRGNLFLAAGNSPLGLRLPLDSLEQAPTVELERDYEPDLFGEFPDLAEYHTSAMKRYKGKETFIKRTTYTSDAYVRTALCTQIREGKLCIFLPPLNESEAFLDLIACIETVASHLGMKVLLEGYEPAHDLRLERIKVTPDPGVIEVNIHPSTSWKTLKNNFLTLYEDARLARLGTEKFMLDGKHTGTGGGNHVTIGAMKPSDSPLLRRPDLLRSLITFWQHHPGLSYLFSGAFIGPTSQAPRVDEGRVENLYELEIAFEQMKGGENLPFWLTDRLLRHMLTDITGNTHRSEFCIDKLYSPDSASGRLGILELRAFDMPPHPQMALMQMLLVRTLVSLFWKKPYAHKLVRWGTQLHDKFLLEHYVKEDIADVVSFLNQEGYAFSLDWFDPFFEFRFPLYGTSTVGQMSLELRSAIEPWHVLGEESSSQGTSRYVDSSLERVQVKVSDFVPERYTLTCNGVAVPLASTGKEGEYVAGVRYKAWQPYSALHPTIGVDTPLIFDVVDTWNKHSIGGMSYYVSHPGGRNYDTFPVNGYEAQARRINRFWDFNHSQGEAISLPPIVSYESSSFALTKRVVLPRGHDSEKIFVYETLPPSLEYPHVLDLRRKWVR